MTKYLQGLRACSLAVCLMASHAAAQDLMASYYTLLTGADLSNSSGVPLGDFCAVVQQDRANYHRFGIRHDMDQPDPVFHDRAMRARIASTCALAAGSEYLPASLAQYGSKFVLVRVYGGGGVPSLVLVSEGAG